MQECKCPLCRQRATLIHSEDHGNKKRYICDLCGHFVLKGWQVNHDEFWKHQNIPKLIYAIKKTSTKDNPIVIEYDKMDDIINSVKFPEKISEKAKEIVKHIYPSDRITIDSQNAIIFGIKDEKEIRSVVTYASNKDWIEFQATSSKSGSSYGVRIKSAGIDLIEQEKNNIKKSKRAFIAMWFNKEMDDAKEAIKSAISECNLEPIRIDDKQFNEKICEEILEEISGSRVLIAEATGHRNGVYFEAGYAYGLGIDVIWTCKKAYLNDLHFDIRQYNCIVWEDTSELKKKLIERIKGTII